MKADFRSAMLKKKTGAPPGTLIHTGEHFSNSTRLTEYSYNAAECIENYPDLMSLENLSVRGGLYALV